MRVCVCVVLVGKMCIVLHTPSQGTHPPTHPPSRSARPSPCCRRRPAASSTTRGSGRCTGSPGLAGRVGVVVVLWCLLVSGWWSGVSCFSFLPGRLRNGCAHACTSCMPVDATHCTHTHTRRPTPHPHYPINPRTDGRTLVTLSRPSKERMTCTTVLSVTGCLAATDARIPSQ